MLVCIAANGCSPFCRESLTLESQQSLSRESGSRLRYDCCRRTQHLRCRWLGREGRQIFRASILANPPRHSLTISQSGRPLRNFSGTNGWCRSDEISQLQNQSRVLIVPAWRRIFCVWKHLKESPTALNGQQLMENGKVPSRSWIRKMRQVGLDKRLRRLS